MAIDADLLGRIRQIWSAARSHAARSVNSAHVAANWLIGQQIVEAEQRGDDRAAYGARLLKGLSQELARDFGTGFSVSAHQYMRAFYLGYPRLLNHKGGPAEFDTPQPSVALTEIQHALRVISADEPERTWKPGQLHGALSWTHYRTLLT